MCKCLRKEEFVMWHVRSSGCVTARKSVVKRYCRLEIMSMGMQRWQWTGRPWGDGCL